MPRFFLSGALNIGTVIALPNDVFTHIKVLRLIPGDAITLFNGEGGEYSATLTSVEKAGAYAEIKQYLPIDLELSYELVLAQALPESSKIDWIIEKAVELGAASVQPLSAQRCVVKLSSERAEKKYQHWNKIIVSASEQCGRNKLTQLRALRPFSEWLAQPYTHRSNPLQLILLSPRSEQSLAQWASNRDPQAVALLIGPEGGFSQAEEDVAIAHGAVPLSMGPRVLRTETAGLAAIATLNALWEKS